MASHTPTVLQQRQIAFVRAVIDTIDKGGEANKAATIVSQYGYKTLALHVRGAASNPLHAHKWCLECLRHKDMALVDQVLQGLEMEEVSCMAEWLSSDAGGGDFFGTALLYSRMAELGRGSTKQEKGEYRRRCIAAADQVSAGPHQVQAVNMAFSNRNRIVLMGDSGKEKVIFGFDSICIVHA